MAGGNRVGVRRYHRARGMERFGRGARDSDIRRMEPGADGARTGFAARDDCCAGGILCPRRGGAVSRGLMRRPGRRLLPAGLAGLLCTAACPASEPLAPILACRTLADPPARLACFDRETAKLVPASAAATPPASAPPAPA